MRTTHALLIGLALLALVASPALAKKEKKGPKITQKVFFDITIGGKEAGSCHRTLRARSRHLPAHRNPPAPLSHWRAPHVQAAS